MCGEFSQKDSSFLPGDILSPEQGKQDRTDKQKISDERTDQEVSGQKDRNKLPDQSGRPVIQCDIGSDAGAFKTDLTCQQQAAVDMIVAGDKRCFLLSVACIDDRL